MAWTGLPVEVGQPILAAQVNELLQAGIERQLWVPPAAPPLPVIAGDSVVDGLHQHVRTAMVNQIAGGRWKWPTGGGNYKTWTIGSDPITNIFKAAFGEMTWRNSVAPTAPKLAQCINDTQAVFDLMKYVAGTIENHSATSVSGHWPLGEFSLPLDPDAYAFYQNAWRDNSIALDEADTELVLDWIDSTPFVHRIYCIDDTRWGYNIEDPFYRVSQMRVANTYRVFIPYTYPIDQVGAKFTTRGYRDERQVWNVFPTERHVTHDPDRQIWVYVRLNGLAPPTGDYAARTTAGTYYATVAASNPQQTRFFESLVNSPEEGEAYLTVYGDRGLPTQCGLGYTAWRQINGEYRITGITEFTEWGFPFGALCRCGFSKLTEDA